MQNVIEVFQPAIPVLRHLFLYYSYPVLLATFLVWLNQLYVLRQETAFDLRQNLKIHKKGLLLALFLVTCAGIFMPKEYRVLADEANLVAVSKSMAFNRTVANSTEGYAYYRNYNSVNDVIEKRPLLVPFLASIVHTLTGYRPANMIAVNALALLAMLAILFIFISNRCGPLQGYLSLILIMCQPIILQASFSAGLEAMTMLFFVIVLVNLIWYLEKPDPEKLALLFIHLILFINVRYELIAVAVFIGLYLLISNKSIFRDMRKYRPLYLMTPLLLLPYFCQRIVKWGDLQVDEKTVKAFSPEHFYSHTKVFLMSLGDLKCTLPYATLVQIVGVLALAVFLWTLIRKRSTSLGALGHAGWIVLMSLLLYWVIITSHFFGRYDHPSSARLFAVFSLCFSLLATWLICRVRALRSRPIVTISLAMCLLLTYWPIAAENRFPNTQTIIREYYFVKNFLRQQSDKNILLITDRPGMYTIDNYSCITLRRAGREKSRIQANLERHLYRDAFVVQHILYSTQKPRAGEELPSPYKLQTVAELQCSAESFIRISRVALPFNTPGVLNG